MENKPLQFFIALRKLRVKVKEGGVEKEKEEEVQVAVPTGRKRVSFRPFCKQVAKNTTFSEQEVAAVLNMGFATARDYVANGDTVELGDLGTLIPSFRSKAVPKGTKFNAREHILKPIIRLVLNRKYFELNDVSYEQVAKPTKP